MKFYQYIETHSSLDPLHLTLADWPSVIRLKTNYENDCKLFGSEPDYTEKKDDIK